MTVRKFFTINLFPFLLTGFAVSLSTLCTAQVINPSQAGVIENGSPITPNLTGASSVFTLGNYAYVVGSSDVLEIFDISLPGSPAHKGSLANGQGGANIEKPLGVVVSGNYAYIANLGGNSLEVVDISDPANPVHKTTLITGSNGSAPHLSQPSGIFVDGNYLYVTALGGWFLEILDISIPGSPVHAGVVSTYPHNPYSVYVNNNVAYVAAYQEIVIFDVSNSKSPVVKSTLTKGFTGASLGTMQSVTVNGNYLYAVDRDHSLVEIVDVSNISSPLNKGSVNTTSTPWTISASGNTLYVGNDGNTLDVIDVTTPTSPVKKAGITSTLFGSSRSIAINGKYAYVADHGSNSMIVLDLNVPAAPKVKANVTTQLGAGGALLDDPQSVFISGKYAYVADQGGNGLEIIDVSNPAAPTHKGSLTNGNGANFIHPRSVFISGNYAYLVGDGSLEIVDVTDPALPIHKGTLNDGGGGVPYLKGSYSIFVLGNYAYIASLTRSALEVVDVTNPALPVHKVSLQDLTNLAGAQSVYVSSYVVSPTVTKTYAFVACSTGNRLTIVDVSTLTAPLPAKTIADGGGAAPFLKGATSVFVTGNGPKFYAYVTSQNSNYVNAGLEIIAVDVTTPSFGQHSGFLQTGGLGYSAPFLLVPTSVYVSGNYAYVTSGYPNNTSFNSDLEIVDVTDPANPKHGASLINLQEGALLDGPTSVFVAGSYAYVTNSNSFTALDVVYLYGSNITSFSPKSGGPGTSVTITGQNFDTFVTASVSGVPATITAVTGTTLILTIPTGATIGKIELISHGQSIQSGTDFVVTPTATPATLVSQNSFTANWTDVKPDQYYVDLSRDNFKSFDYGGIGVLKLDGANTVYISGTYAYVASNNSNALEIVDISNPTAPGHVGSLVDGGGVAPFLDGADGVFVSGNYAYVVSSNSNALEIIDITNPALPVHKGSLIDGGGAAPYLNYPTDLYVAGNYAYVASAGSNALEIIDISNPASPVHASSVLDGGGSAPFLNYIWSVIVSGHYAYAASYNSNALEIIDITNPASPVHKGSLTSSTAPALGGANGLYISGNYAYVASYGANALEIVDISNPALPIHVGSLVDGGGSAPYLNQPNEVVVSGNYAYVTSFASNALEIINVTNPASPVHAGALLDGGGNAPYLNGAYTVSVSGNYAYVASNNSNALEVVNVTSPSLPSHSAALKTTFAPVGTASSYSFTGLNPGTGYQYRVRAFAGTTMSDNSNAISITTLPLTPTANAATLVTQSGFTANWTSSPGATGYFVDVAYDHAFSNYLVGYNSLSIPSGTTSSQIVNGLDSYTTCYYRVRSNGVSGASTSSNVITVITLDIVPPAINSAGTPNPSVVTLGNTPFLNTIITDNVSVDTAQLFYRGIADKVFQKVNLQGPGGRGGSYSITLQPTWVDSEGLEYYFRAIDEAGNKTVTASSYVQLVTPSLAIPALPTGTKQSDYGIVSFPYQLPTDNKVTTVYSGVPWNDNTKAAMWWWNPLAQNNQGKYDQYGSATTFQTVDPGRGYWVITNTSVTPQLANVPAPKYNRANLYSMILRPGWNEVGNPYPVAISWDDVMAFNQKNNITSFGSLSIYDGTGYKSASGAVLLNPFAGGFVKNLSSSDITIQIPFAGETNIGGRIAALDSDISQDAWNVFLHVTQEEFTNQLGGFGMHPSSSEGPDRYDNFNPPQFMGSPEVNFRNTDYPSAIFSNDMVPSQENYHWQFTPNGQLDQIEQLTWSENVRTSSSKQLLLVDEQNLEIIDMLHVNSYQFNLKKGSKFSIFYGSDLNHKIALPEVAASAPYPNPLSSESTINLNLPESGGTYQVALQVFNNKGELLGSTDSTLASGIQPLKFGLADQVPSGMYLYRLFVRAENIAVSFTGKIIKL